MLLIIQRAPQKAQNCCSIKVSKQLLEIVKNTFKNCRIHLELNQIDDCILSSAGKSAKFKIIDAKLHVPIVTLSTKDNVNLTKQKTNGFKISVYCNNYQTIPAKLIN